MQLHQLKPKSKNKSKKRVGRGGKRGTYSGRGIKGQKARSGRRIRPQWRDTLKKIPKKRGYRVKAIFQKAVVLNLKNLEKNFREGDEISPKILVQKGLVPRISGKIPKVKILGEGEVNKRFVIKDCLFSARAREALEKSGSRIIGHK